MPLIVPPEGKVLGEPVTEGEGLCVADLDMALILKRKRMMDSVGHYARPELLSLLIDRRPAATFHDLHPIHGPDGDAAEALSRSNDDEQQAWPLQPTAHQ